MMVDDRPEDTGSPPDSGRAKRAPPTIDLEATEVSGDSQERPPPAAASPSRIAERPPASAMFRGDHRGASPAPAPPRWCSAVAWFAGMPSAASPRTGAPPVNTAAIDDLAARVASVESKASARPPAPAPDPAAAARIEALEKSLAALRGELATARAQSEKLAAAHQ